MNALVALVGNPNTGKSSLFNGLTGRHQRIGNWPGVTVELAQGQLIGHPQITLVDLPGVYGFTATSPDEVVSRDFLLSRRADVIVSVVDASNLERNLYLTVQMREAGLRCILALNMFDKATRRGLDIDTVLLEEELGIPVIPVCAHNTRDLERLKAAILDALHLGEPLPPLRVGGLYTQPQSGQVRSKDTPPLRLAYSPALEQHMDLLAERLGSLAPSGWPKDWLALRLLEQDSWAAAQVSWDAPLKAELDRSIQALTQTLGAEPDLIAAETRFTFITRLLDKALRRIKSRPSLSERVDHVVLHRFWGYPIFFLILFGLFSLTMALGGAFIDFFDTIFGYFFVDLPTFALRWISAPDWVVALIAQGLGAGIQTVSTFTPIVFFLFLFLALLEDSGYLSRAAFLMDRLMRSLGLPGKAFVPLILGFGCTVPAITATRTLENPRDRMLTVFMAPLMSCGARLPVYALFCAALFPRSASLVIFSLYLVGLGLSIGSGLLLRHSLFRGGHTPFVLEIPHYHLPRPRHALLITWRNLRGFVFKAGKIIVGIVAILGFLNAWSLDGTPVKGPPTQSLLAAAGRAVQPVFAPMGVTEDNWPAAVALFTGLFAKEAVVGTLAGLYAQVGTDSVEPAPSEEGEEGSTMELASPGEVLWEALLGLLEEGKNLGSRLVDPLGLWAAQEEAETLEASTLQALAQGFGNDPWRAYAYLLFVLIYIPCVAALSTMVRETGWVWATLSALYLALLAWCISVLFFQLSHGRDPLWIGAALAILGGVAGVFFVAGSRLTEGPLPFYVPRKSSSSRQ